MQGTHGSRSALKVLKDLNSHLKLLVLGVKHTGKTVTLGGMWFSTYSTGVPKFLPLFNQAYLQGKYQLIVDISSMVILFKVEPEVDVKSITDPSLNPEGTAEWLRKFQGSFRWTGSKLVPKSDGFHMSIKAGPNAPSAILGAGVDLVALISNPGIWDTLMYHTRAVGRKDMADQMESFKNSYLNRTSPINIPKLGLMLAKLIFLSEKAGKTRIVYVLNYWHQELMFPLHQVLMKWLSSQPQDGTFDQRAAVEKVRLWTQKGLTLWSFDLSNATDRWPKEHQYLILRKMVGDAWADAWWHTMGIPPYVPELSSYVKYAVGQPMGAYASWASFAVTHHMTMRYLSGRLGVSNDHYVILGDDLVIANEDLARSYQETCHDLGVTISLRKSVLGDQLHDGVSSAEFAKRLLKNGVDLTPLSPQILDLMWNRHQWWMFFDLAQALQRRGYVVARNTLSIRLDNPHEQLLQLLSKKDQELVVTCLGNPLWEWLLREEDNQLSAEGHRLTGNKACVRTNPFGSVINHAYLTYYAEILYDRLFAKYTKLNKLRADLTKGDQVQQLDGYLLDRPQHPVRVVIDSLSKTILGMAMAVNNGEVPKDFIDVMTDVDYLEGMMLKGTSHRQWKDRKDLRKSMGPMLITKAYHLSK